MSSIFLQNFMYIFVYDKTLLYQFCQKKDFITKLKLFLMIDLLLLFFCQLVFVTRYIFSYLFLLFNIFRYRFFFFFLSILVSPKLISVIRKVHYKECNMIYIALLSTKQIQIFWGVSNKALHFSGPNFLRTLIKLQNYFLISFAIITTF